MRASKTNLSSDQLFRDELEVQRLRRTDAENVRFGVFIVLAALIALPLPIAIYQGLTNPAPMEQVKEEVR